ncbi:MAG: hypothetical protein IT529_20360 [Burkholderiales bacterium]|nr:hypothetical protein [Burkholderiales bacterium]
MTAWLATTFEKYPELAVFLVVGVGYWIGSFKVRGFGPGPVTGSLIVGVLLAGPVTGYLHSIRCSSWEVSPARGP